MEQINFSTNWNGKLNCKIFTTFRLWNERKYLIGRKYEITFKQIEPFNAEILDIRKLQLSQLNEWTAGLDSGYSLSEFKNLIQKMYKGKVPNVNQAFFAFILLKKIA